MQLSKKLGLAAAAICLVALFLPFASVFGISAGSLFGADIVKALMFLALGAGSGSLTYVGGKTMSIVGLILGALALLLAFVWMGQVSTPLSKPGIGIYMMIVGGGIATVAGVMSMMKK